MPDGKPDFSWLGSKPPPSMQSVEGIGGTQQNYEPGTFEFTPKYNQDNYKLRAQNQGWAEQLGITLGNLIPNVVTGLVEAVGYIPELWDKDNDYTNALTQTMQEWKNPLGEAYRENPNETWDMGDSAWWFNNFGQLTESAATFAIQGAGFAKLFGGMAKGAAALLGGTARARSITSGVANVLSATALAYQEGAMSGAQVYENLYNTRRTQYLRNGMDPVEASRLAQEDAAEGAAATVKMNTLMNTVMNIGILSPLFRNPSDKVLDWWKTTGKQQANETAEMYAKRIAKASAADKEIAQFLAYRSPWNSLPAEMVKEGVEEVNTQYAEQVGMRRGEGSDEGLGHALLNFERYLDDVSNDEGLLNFALGAFGGGAQTVLIDAIPQYRQKVDSDGNIIYKKLPDGSFETKNGKRVAETQLMRPRTHDQNGIRRYFSGVKEVLLHDAKRIDELQKKLVDASSRNDVIGMEQARAELFSVGALDAVRKGLTDNWKMEFQNLQSIDNENDLGEELQPQIDELTEQLANAEEDQKPVLKQALDNLIQQQASLAGKTEAMIKGLATSKEDNQYKERASAAVKDLDHLGTIHQELQKRLNVQNDPVAGDVADHLYFRHANLYLTNRAIEKEEKELQQMEQNLRPIDTPVAVIEREIDRYNSEIKAWNETIKRLNDDINILQKSDKSGNIAAISGLIEKYRGKAYEDGELADAIDDLVEKIKEKQKEYKTAITGAEDLLGNSTGFKAWLENNVGKTFDDYLSLAGENALVQQRKDNLQAAKAQRDIAADNLREIESKKNIDKLYAAVRDDRKKAIDKITERTKNANIEAFLLEANKKNAANIPVQQKESLIAKLKVQKAELEKQFNAAVRKQNELQQQVTAQAKDWGNIFRFDKLIKLKSQLANAKREVKYFQQKLDEVNRQLDMLGVELVHAQSTAEVTASTTAEEISQQEKAIDPDGSIPPQSMTPNPEESLPPVAPTELNQSETDALDSYLAFVQQFDPGVQQAFEALVNDFSSGEPLSLTTIINTLKPHVRRKAITDAQVTEAWFTIKKMVEELKMTEETEEIEESEPTEDEKESAQNPPVIPPLEESIQPIIVSNEHAFTPDGIDDLYWEDAAKTTDTVKANSSDFQYGTYKDGTTLKLTTITAPDADGVWAPQIDQNVNTDRMLPGVISVGDEVVMQIDPDWDGDSLNAEGTAPVHTKFGDYADNEGKIRTDDAFKFVGYANVPIKITHKKTGKVIGYFPTNDWIHMTNDAGNYRNVEQTRVADESRINLEIRKHLAEQWNKNPNHKITTRVSNRTAGRVLYAGKIDGRNTRGNTNWHVKSAAKMLPGDLQLAVRTKDGLMLDKGIKANSQLQLVRDNQGLPIMNEIGSVNVLLPMPNGAYKASALKSEKLTRKSDITTVTKVIELNLKYNTPHFSAKEQSMVDKIEAATGFDVTTQRGLKDFIEQFFTYTTGFGDVHLSADAPANADGQKVPRWLIAVPESAPKLIKIGMTYSGQPDIKARLVRGEIDPAFVNALKTGLENRYRVVNFNNENIKGINSTGPFKTVRISEDNKVVVKEHKSYNDYVKSFTSTPVYGKTQVKGQYVYAANSQILLDMAPMLPESPVAATPVPAVSPADAGTVDVDDPFAGMFGITSESMAVPPNYVKPVIEAKGNTIEVTLDNLQELYNFTPADDRNGKSVQEVYNYLTNLNIGAIGDTYNPFVKCS